MAFTGITATENEIDYKIGAGADTGFTDVMKTQELLQAESYVNVMTGYNWSDWYATTPNVDVKYIITEATASLVGIQGIKYNFLGLAGTGITRIEAEDRINVLFHRVDQIIKILNQTGTQKFMQDA